MSIQVTWSCLLQNSVTLGKYPSQFRSHPLFLIFISLVMNPVSNVLVIILALRDKYIITSLWSWFWLLLRRSILSDPCHSKLQDNANDLQVSDPCNLYLLLPCVFSLTHLAFPLGARSYCFLHCYRNLFSGLSVYSIQSVTPKHCLDAHSSKAQGPSQTT